MNSPRLCGGEPRGTTLVVGALAEVDIRTVGAVGASNALVGEEPALCCPRDLTA